MRVLLVHNRYQSSAPSGEDAVVAAEEQLLRHGGVEVARYERTNDELAGAGGALRAVLDITWSRRSYRELTAVLERERPDVTHFHNLWYVISPSGYAACRDANVPVVQTLHNYRMFCANGLLLREGRACEDCVGRPPWRGVVHGCFRSRLHSVPVVGAELWHRWRGTWTTDIDAFVALSEFARGRFEACGLPGDRIFVKPNSLAGELPGARGDAGYGVYLGRLSVEKGIEHLLGALHRHPVPMKIIGDGPLRARLVQLAAEWRLTDVEFTGRLDRDSCLRLLSQASFLVLPSICYENFPMSILEAYACEKPVLASRLGSIPELVEHGVTGLLFAPGDEGELAARLRELMADPGARQAMGRNGRMACEAKYAPARNLELLLGVYRSAIQRNGRSRVETGG
jgi:glycosyltransferase involved in cell wall biosynthesis